MMGIRVTTQPALEPITLQEAKDHLRVDDDNEDALISELIKAAREHCENHIQMPLITQSLTYYTDCFDGVMELKPNLQSVTSINYIDTDGNSQLLASTEYDVSTTDIIGSVYPAIDKTWPSTQSVKNAVEIEFIAGYGLAADVPAPIKQAMLLLIGHYYQNREAVTVGVSITVTPMAVDMLLAPYRVISL